MLGQLPPENFKEAITQLCSVQVNALTQQLNQLNNDAIYTKTGALVSVLVQYLNARVYEVGCSVMLVTYCGSYFNVGVMGAKLLLTKNFLVLQLSFFKHLFFGSHY